jgi:N-acylneuraminate cytidylyltransferase
MSGTGSIAIIPARGGSKRIPGKNIKPFLGKPIIAYAIECARETGLFDRIVVSTDSDEIMQVAREFGAETPFRRPDEIADDFATTAAVLEHAVETLLADAPFTHFCCIYPTAVFMRGADLATGAEMIRREDATSVFPVTSFAAPIFRAFRLKEDGRVAFIWPEHRDTRSNDLPDAYHDAGQFYWLSVERFRREKVIYGPESIPIVLPRHRVHDIDTPEDWRAAELLYPLLAGEGAA